MLASILVLPLVVPAVADAGKRPAKIKVSRSAKPGDSGWYTEPVRASLRLTVRDRAKRVDFCNWSSLTILPSGDGSGFARYWRRAKVAHCRIAIDRAETGITTLSLGANDGGWSVSRSLTVRVDREKPSVEPDDPPVAFTGRHVEMQGTVSDAFSGPGTVRVRLTPRDGGDGVTLKARCPECGGDFRGCSFGREPACGWSSRWSVEAQVEPGAWTAVIEATDVAGNLVRREPIDLVVLP